MNITVRWGGKDVAVEMRPEVYGVWLGDVDGGVRLRSHPPRHVSFRSPWDAFVELPDPWQHFDRAELTADGDSAQEALDKLAGQLRQIAEWATNALGAP